MKVIADLCVIPMGVGVSVSEHVAACQRVLEEARLEFRVHAYGTNIEGEWDEVLAAVKRCHELLHDSGVARISSSIEIGTRTNHAQSLDDKVRSVQPKHASGQIE